METKLTKMSALLNQCLQKLEDVSGFNEKGNSPTRYIVKTREERLFIHL